MAKHKDIQDIGILLANEWKLVPLDDRNWELCHLHVAQPRGGREGGTEPRWYRCGRFYQYNTVDEAMLYVADQLVKAKAWAQHMELGSALVEYRAIAESIRAAASGAVA